MIAYIITAVVILFLMYYILKALWKVSRFLSLPIAIVLFVIFVFIVFKIFFSAANVEKLNEGIQNSGIAEVNKNMIEQAAKSAENVIRDPRSKEVSSGQNVPAKEKEPAAHEEQVSAPRPVPPADVETPVPVDDTPAPAPAPVPRFRKPAAVKKSVSAVKPAPAAEKTESQENDMFKMDTDKIFQ